MDKMPVALQVLHSSTWGNAPLLTHLFADKQSACDAFDKLLAAAKAYHDRSNDRERMVTVEAMSGPIMVDVSQIACLAVDDALGKNRDAQAAWQARVGELHRLGRGGSDTVTEPGT